MEKFVHSPEFHLILATYVTSLTVIVGAILLYIYKEQQKMKDAMHDIETNYIDRFRSVEGKLDAFKIDSFGYHEDLKNSFVNCIDKLIDRIENTEKNILTKIAEQDKAINQLYREFKK